MKQHIATSNFAIYKPRKDRCDTCTAYNAGNVLCIMFGMSQRVTCHPARFSVCCCLPTPMTLASGGVWCSRFWSTSQRIYPSGHQLHHSSVVCPQIQIMVRMWMQLKRLCASCVWVLQRDIVVLYVIWCRLWVNMIWGRVIYMFWVGEGCDEWGGKFV